MSTNCYNVDVWWQEPYNSALRWGRGWWEGGLVAKTSYKAVILWQQEKCASSLPKVLSDYQHPIISLVWNLESSQNLITALSFEIMHNI